MKNKGLHILLIIITVIISSQIVLAREESLTIGEAIKMGLKNNSSIVNSRRDMEKAELKLEHSYLSYYPDINLQLTYNRLGESPLTPSKYLILNTGETESNPFTGMPEDVVSLYPVDYTELSSDQYSTSLSFQQPIYLGGRIKKGIEMARKGVSISRIQYEKEVSDTIFQIIQSYYNVLMAKGMVEIQEEFLTLIKKQGEAVRARYKAGIGVKADLLEIEIEKRRQEQAIKTSRNQLVLAKKRLGLLLCLKNDDYMTVRPDKQPEIGDSFDKHYQQALNNRPELKLLLLNKEMIKLNKNLEKTIYKPSIVLAGSYNWQGDQLDFEEGSWNMTLSASMKIFDGGKDRVKGSEYQVELQKNEESLNNLKQMINLELQEAFMKLNEAEQELSLASLNLKNAEENLRIARESYNAGMGSNLDVIRAQSTLKQVKVNHLQAEYKYQMAKYQILYKRGELKNYWEDVINNEIQ